MKLANATLDKLPPAILRPRYDRTALTPGIVHIGLGNFHRAHMAWYLHRLMQAGHAMDWAIIGAGVRSYDAAMRDKLLAQDCLTTLIELDSAGVSAEVVGSMIDYAPVETSNGALIRQMTDPATRIVSLTVTEGGYFRANGAFDADHDDIRHDAANPHTPRTVFGAIVAALGARRQRGDRPFAALSCDNLQGNGDMLRHTTVSLAHLSDPALAQWIDANCSFPNSMVDCIVPATGPTELALANSLGIDDQAPVTHEKFRHWVMEDDFCAGRPDWDKVGAIFTNDVAAFEAMKLRVLNAGHQVIANPGDLLGITTIAEAIAHPLIGAFFHKVAQEEILPHVEAVPGFTPNAYLALIERRFANPAIVDTTRRVAFDGSSRHSGFVLPSIRDGLRSGGTAIVGLALVEALWARYCYGQREDHSTIEPNDPHWTQLKSAASQARTRPDAWLQQRQFYGDLGDDSRFAEAFGRWLSLIWSDGCERALRTYLSH